MNWDNFQQQYINSLADLAPVLGLITISIIFWVVIRHLKAKMSLLQLASDELNHIIAVQREIIVRFTSEGIITYANPAFWSFFGEQARPNCFILDVMHIQDEDWTRIRQLLSRSSAGIYDYPANSASGLRWIEWTSREITAGSAVTAYQAVGRDVTDRVMAQEEMARSEARYRLLVENSPVGILLVDQHGHILDVNQSLLHILGSPSRDDTMAINIYQFQPLIEAGIADHFRQCMDGRQISTDGWYTSKWGRHVYLHYFLTPIKLDASNAVLGYIIDQTADWYLKDQLRQAQKMEAMGRLAAGVAHDYNNYLAVMDGYLRLLGTQVTDLSLCNIIAQIQTAVEQSRTLTTHLLAFSRRQKMHLLQVLDVNAVIAGAEDILRRLAGREVELITRYAPNLSLVRADPGQIVQVILNLVTNARDAITTIQGTITIQTLNVEGGVRISVSDTGAGIADDVLPHIFEPFFSTKDGPSSSSIGLGLFTVYGIVRQSGGHIDVESQLGQGTTFSVYLPQSEK